LGCTEVYARGNIMQLKSRQVFLKTFLMSCPDYKNVTNNHSNMIAANKLVRGTTAAVLCSSADGRQQCLN
jgi:hypothetical protein